MSLNNSIFSLSSLPNPLWNRAYSAGEEILQYLQDVSHQFGVYQHIRFNTRVTKAMWSEDQQKWEVITQEEERLAANFLIDGGGRFHVPHVPQFKGETCYLATTKYCGAVVNFRNEFIWGRQFP